MTSALLVLALLSATPPPSQRHLNVTGEGRVAFKPNRVVVTLAITAGHRDAATALKQADEKARKVQEAIRKTGAPATVATMNPGVPSPEYRGNEVVAFNVIRTLNVELTDLARVDEVLTVASKAGATPHGNPTFGNTDQRTFETKARILAATTARERASGMLEAVGGKLGLPASVSEGAPRVEYPAVGGFTVSSEGVVVTAWSAIELAVVAQVAVQFDIEAP